LLMSAFLAVYMTTAPVFGAYGDRPWRMRLVAAGVALWSIATALAGFAHSYAMLLTARAWVGIGEAAYAAIAPAILADYFPERLRGRIYAIFYAAIPVGAALGYTIGGLVDHLYGWRAAFFVAGFPGLVLAGLALTIINPRPLAADAESTESGHPAASASALGFRAYGLLLRNRTYVRTVLGYAAYTFAFGGIAVWMPTYLIRVRGIAPVTANTQLGAVVVVTGFVGTFLGGWIGDTLNQRVRHGYLWLSGLTMLLGAPFAYIALTAPTPSTYWTALAIADLLLFVSTSPINAVIVSGVPPAARAAAMAASILTIHVLGDVPSPWIIGRLSDAISLNRAVLIIPAATLVSGLIWTYAAIQGPRRA
jgi:MFS transporter, Spinster family, sphingosine-1-phosphate transporter